MRPLEREAKTVKEAKRIASAMRTLGYGRIVIRAHGCWELENGKLRWGPHEVLRLDRTRVLARVAGEIVKIGPTLLLGSDSPFLTLRGERR